MKYRSLSLSLLSQSCRSGARLISSDVQNLMVSIGHSSEDGCGNSRSLSLLVHLPDLVHQQVSDLMREWKTHLSVLDGEENESGVALL
jgi:hypothetical protein